MQTGSEDAQLIRMLRAARVLDDAKGHKLKAPNGVIPIVCPDCDQAGDIDRHIESLLVESGSKIRLHSLKQHGGGMLVSHTCPIGRKYMIDDYVVENIGIARSLKEINTIILFVHAPCGAAQLAHLNVVEVLYHLVEAKKRIKAIWPHDKIGCFFHVDYCEEGRKRTYFLSCNAFEKWFAENNGSQYVTHMNTGNGVDHDQLIGFPPLRPSSS